MTMMSKLPPNVRPVKDRHGKVRYRFRKKGYPSKYLPGEPDSAEFHKRYAEILEAGEIEREAVQSPRIVKPRSLDDLITRYKKSPRWRKKAPSTQIKHARILERFSDRVDIKGRRYGERPVQAISVAWLERILGQMWETPAAANELRKVLSGVLDMACRMDWLLSNPMRLTERYEEGEGWHDWTDAEIEKYRDTHPLGTMARLAMELALNTAARRENVAGIERDHIEGGRISVAHIKGNHETSVPMLPTTKAAIDALPAAPIRHLVLTEFGKPFTPAGLGNRMRKWCDAAGLPHCSIHGLRKSMSRMLAESGATDAQGQSVTGHTKDDTFRYYRSKADRVKLADDAMSNLLPRFDVQPKKGTK